MHISRATHHLLTHNTTRGMNNNTRGCACNALQTPALQTRVITLASDVRNSRLCDTGSTDSLSMASIAPGMAACLLRGECEARAGVRRGRRMTVLVVAASRVTCGEMFHTLYWSPNLQQGAKQRHCFRVVRRATGVAQFTMVRTKVCSLAEGHCIAGKTQVCDSRIAEVLALQSAALRCLTL
jgi:hypothetical protein